MIDTSDSGLPLFMRDFSCVELNEIAPLEGRDYVYAPGTQKSVWSSSEFTPTYARTAYNDQRKSDETYIYPESYELI